MNLEEMFQFPYEVFFVIWYDSVYHIQYIHLYMSAHYYFIIIIFMCATVLHHSDLHGM